MVKRRRKNYSSHLPLNPVSGAESGKVKEKKRRR